MPDSTTPPAEAEKKKRKRRKKTERLFTISDADYLQQSRVKHKLFENYLAQFTAFDPLYDVAFAAAWLAKIEQCELLPPDNTLLNEQAGYKDDLFKTILTTLVKKVSKIEYYAQKAYVDEPDALYEFMFHKVNRVDQYDLQFIVNCHVIRLLAANEHNALLAAEGMQQIHLDELEAAYDEAANYEIYHERTKRIRLMQTRLRIKGMNELFKLNESVKKAAIVIFEDKPTEAGLWG